MDIRDIRAIINTTKILVINTIMNIIVIKAIKDNMYITII
jgi:hypothetical protein